MLREQTEIILRKENLEFDQAAAAAAAIFDGKCSEVAIAGFLTALAAKGEAAVEVAAMAQGLRDHAIPVRPQSTGLVDIVGTGGDGSLTFNISTTSAFVAAGAGVKVAKHGNRAITSKCGSADVLAELGVKIDATPDVIAQCIDQANIGFMFAPCHHPTMKYVQPIRKALGYRTVFNVLGPLANPAFVEKQIVGVAKPYLLDVMAEALKLIGVKQAIVAHGDGMDEFSVCGPTDVVELRNGKLKKYTVDCTDYNIPRADVKDLLGGDFAQNVAITRGILDNSITGPCRNVVLLNAAAAVWIDQKAADLAEAITVAGESLTSGKAAGALESMIKISNS